MEQEIFVQTEDGVERFFCILRNAQEGLYQIIESDEGESSDAIQWTHERIIRIFLYNGLKIEGKEVYSFASISTKLHRLGTLV